MDASPAGFVIKEVVTMNLEELRQAMASDATKENEQLKSEIKLLRKQLRESKDKHEALNNRLTRDCRVLAKRCWASTLGSMCCFCGLDTFECPHAMDYEQRLKAIEKFLEEPNNDEN